MDADPSPPSRGSSASPEPGGSGLPGRPRRWRSFGGRLLIGVAVGSLLMAGSLLGVDREVGRRLDAIPKVDVSVAPLPPNGANFLVVGSDSRAFVSDDLEQQAFGDPGSEGGQRSDTIMVVHVEPKASRTIVVSFPRDLWVNIPGHGSAKINAAYNYGPQAVIDTITQNFGVEINHYVEVDFKTFVGLVDAIGGVQVYVPYPAKDEFTGLGVSNPGCQSFDGERSLQWVRSRSLEYFDQNRAQWVYADIIPDIGRIGRQQEFIRQVISLSVNKSMGDPFSAYTIADQVVKGLKVDETFNRDALYQLLDAFRTFDAADPNSLEFATMPWKTGPNQGVQSVLYASTDIAGPLLARLNTFDKRPRPVPAESTIRVRIVNRSGRSELGAAIKRELEQLGFQVVGVEEDGGPTQRYGSEITWADGKLDQARLLLRYIDPRAALKGVDPAVAAAGADVTWTVAADFIAITVPADRFEATTATTAAPSTDETAVVDGAIPQSVTPTPVQLGAPAVRVGC